MVYPVLWNNKYKESLNKSYVFELTCLVSFVYVWIKFVISSQELEFKMADLIQKCSKIIKFFSPQCSDIPNLVTKLEWLKAPIVFMCAVVSSGYWMARM
jgi:hypothetical protein